MAVHTRDPALAVRAEGLGLSQPALHTETLSLKEGLCVGLGQQRGQGFSDTVFSSISGRQYGLEVGKIYSLSSRV